MITLSVLALINIICVAMMAGAGLMFGLGVWAGERQKARNARILAAIQDAVEQEQEDVALQED